MNTTEKKLTENADHICVAGHIGTWYVINAENIAGEDLFLLESEQYGDEAANLIVDGYGRLILEEVYNGFDDYREYVLTNQSELQQSFYCDKVQSIYEQEVVQQIPEKDMITYYSPDQGTTCTKAGVTEQTIEARYNKIAADRERIHIEFEKMKEHSCSFTIYQLPAEPKNMELLFCHYDAIRQKGYDVCLDNYEKIYSAPLSAGMTLEGIYQEFNIDHPADYTGRSLSVSDLVVIDYPGSLTAHYVDPVGFVEQPQLKDELLRRSVVIEGQKEQVLADRSYQEEFEM